MPTVPDVHRRGTRAAQPAATTVTVGTLYAVTDEALIERSNGAAWESYGGSGGGAVAPRVGGVTLVIDGGGAVITTGVKGFLEVPFSGTITAWSLLSSDAAVTSGSIVVDVWKRPLTDGYPPTVAHTITAADKPTLASATSGRSTTLTGWTTAVTAGDVLGFTVDSVAAFTRVTFTLTIESS